MMPIPTIRPPRVKPGDTVAIVSTSSPIKATDLKRLVDYFESRGYPVKVMPDVLASTGYIAGTAAQRAANLMAAFTDSRVGLIVPANGGKGAAHLLPLLDYNIIASNPKVFTGMSDPSIICNALFHRAGLMNLHGPSGYDFFQTPVNAETEAAFWQIVSGSITTHLVKGDRWRVVRGKRTVVSGKVIGGHLGTIRTLIGTPYMPDVAGAVLFLEEVFVPWVVIDQALTHLRLAGVFENIRALVIGVPIDCKKDDAPDESWEDMIIRCVGGDFPVITNVEFGHTARKIPLPIGGTVEFDLASACPVLRYRDDMVVAK